jgi:hypothetical protein
MPLPLLRPALLLLSALPVFAQLPAPGITWERYEPPKKIHLCNEYGKHMMYEWSTFQELQTSAGRCANYTYEAATEAETFRLYGKNSNRAEIRLVNEYEFGARQFEGYVTVGGPLEDQCLMQVWGSAQGATQLMLRGYAENGGTLAVNCGSSGRVKLIDQAYGREIKVNIIHLQENVGNKFVIYLDDKLVAEFPDNEKAVNNFNGNYHKYGVYGTVRDGHENPTVVWRRVRHYRDAGGVSAEKAVQTINFPALTPQRVGDADFDAGATLDSKLPLRYRSSDPKVASVTEAGRVTIVGPGTALILAFHEGNAQYHPTNLFRELRVEAAR